MIKTVRFFCCLTFIVLLGVNPGKVFSEEDDLAKIKSLEKKNQELLQENISLFKDAVAKEKENLALKNRLVALSQMSVRQKDEFAKSENSKDAKSSLSAAQIAHYNLGFIYAQKKELDNAIGEYKKILEISPESRDAHFNLGYLYALKGNLESAVREYEEDLNIDPNDKQAHYNLAIIYHKSLKDEEKAQEHYRKFLE